MTEWISVKEKMPRHGKKVLVFCPGEHFMYPEKGKIFVADVRKFGHSVTCWESFSQAYETEYVDATHWAELPNPPEST